MGSSTTLVAHAVAVQTRSPVLLVTAHLDDADEAFDELAALGSPSLLLPALEILPGETGVATDLLPGLALLGEFTLHHDLRGDALVGQQ